jgi:hypothetical protein
MPGVKPPRRWQDQRAGKSHVAVSERDVLNAKRHARCRRERFGLLDLQPARGRKHQTPVLRLREHQRRAIDEDGIGDREQQARLAGRQLDATQRPSLADHLEQERSRSGLIDPLIRLECGRTYARESDEPECPRARGTRRLTGQGRAVGPHGQFDRVALVLDIPREDSVRHDRRGQLERESEREDVDRGAKNSVRGLDVHLDRSRLTPDLVRPGPVSDEPAVHRRRRHRTRRDRAGRFRVLLDQRHTACRADAGSSERPVVALLATRWADVDLLRLGVHGV